MKRVSTKTGQLEVLDLDGGKHELAQLWAERPVVLAFVRHFG